MRKFERLSAIAAPYPQTNVDTDRIIRIERCTRTPREEMGLWAFEIERLLPDGGPNPQFVTNRPPFREARILVAGENFGCGSSREMAVWAIAGMGIRCVIAPSFGEIFFNNCFQNGLLPIRLPGEVVDRLLEALAAAPPDSPARARITVDLDERRIETPWGESIGFEVEAMRRTMLLEGLDQIGLTLKRLPQIEAYQARMRESRPWIYRV